MLRRSTIFLIVITLCLEAKSQKLERLPVDGYSLFWQDDFNGQILDPSKWDYRGLGKRDDAIMTKEAVRLDGAGHLIIRVDKTNGQVSSGMISTEHIFATRYGYYECRAKFTHTAGTFPGFWLQSPTIDQPNSTPAENGVELDIFEYYPHANRLAVSQAMHYGGYGSGHRMVGPVWGPLQATTDDFHVVGFEWTPTSYRTFVDGVQTFSGNQYISKVSEFIVLSVGVYQQAAGPLDAAGLPDQFIVDYVRVYKKK